MKKKHLLAGLLTASLLFNVAAPARASAPDRTMLPISGGNGHTVAVTADGEVYAWGNNRSGQLGVENAPSPSKPVLVPGIKAVSVAAGYDFTVALDYTGAVYVWGMGQDMTPVEVQGLSGVTKIDAGQTDILALRTDGTVWQWTYGAQPEQVKSLSRIVDISAGGGHNLALTVDGYVYAWGSNTFGQLGNGNNTDQYYPVLLSLLNVIDISAGFTHSLAATYDGKVYAWGNNEYGQLGNGTTKDSAFPVQVKGLSNITSVAAGGGISMALNNNGAMSTWGYGEFGQLGNNTTSISSSTPNTVGASIGKVKYIECGLQHCMAVTDRGVMYIWGRNRDGQIGTSANSNALTPKKVREGIYLEGSYRFSAVASASSWAQDEMNKLYISEKVFPLLWGNYTDGVTRAEFAALLVSLYESVTGIIAGSSTLEKYTDIKDHPLETYLRKSVALGLLEGSSATTMSPDRILTRQEGVKILCSFVSKAQSTDISDKLQNLSFYQDARQIADWAAPYVFYAYENDIMKGNGEGFFNPLDVLNREQALVMAQRMVVKYGWD